MTTRTVTFIGGSQDLTRRAIDGEAPVARYMKFAKLRPVDFNEPPMSFDPEKPVSFEEETYTLVRVSRHHWVGLLEDDLR